MEGPMEVNSTRFPSGIAALADWLHGKGKYSRLLCQEPCIEDQSQEFCGRSFSFRLQGEHGLATAWKTLLLRQAGCTI